MQEQQQCQTLDGMLMTFEFLQQLRERNACFYAMVRKVTFAMVLILIITSYLTHVRNNGLLFITVLMYAVTSIIGHGLMMRAANVICSMAPARLVGLTLGQLDGRRMCSVTFVCLGCGEQTTIEFKDAQYEQFAPGAELYARVANLEIRYIQPARHYKRKVRIKHQGQVLDLTCRLERKADLKLDDLMLRFLGGLMYTATELQLKSELERIAEEFTGRPLKEYSEFIRGFGLEPEGMPYRARVTRVREVKVKPASTGAGQ